MGELDRVLGGGLVPGAVVLVAGEPGIGKSTLLLDVAARAARGGQCVLYVSGEESAAQVRMRAERIEAMAATLFLAAETDLASVLGQIEAVQPDLVVVDSVQTIAAPRSRGRPATSARSARSRPRLIQAAKTRGIAVLLVGHVTKDGSIAGPRVLEHLVDVVIQFEGDRHSRLRLVRAVKNRYGPTDEVGCFDLSDVGIVGLADPSGLFLSHRDLNVAGTCVTVTLEGAARSWRRCRRSSRAARRRRAARHGLDASRVAMVLAVLDRRARVPVGASDAYLSTVGGVRLGEPAADLAIALSVASSVADRPLPHAVAFGEVGLAGGRRAAARVGDAAPAHRGGALGVPDRVHAARRPGFRPDSGGYASRRGGRRGRSRRRCPGRLHRWPGSPLDSRRASGGRDAAEEPRTGGTRGVATPVERSDDLLRATLAAVAPGTDLRDGLERILRGRTGALIVLGNDKVVESISSGGFPLDVEFSATRLRELSKMDGAILLDRDGSRILRANTQLVPDPSIETSESGTRHRTAERVAIQTGFPVVSVSQSMQIIALYVGGKRHVVEGSAAILSKANQALQTLERYKSRLDEVTSTLSALEIEDLVTVRDVASVLQRLEMVRRISEEISDYVVELGDDGRLLGLQLEELAGGLTADRELVIRDYIDSSKSGRTVDEALDALMELSVRRLLDLGAGARAVGFAIVGDARQRREPAGYRLLTKVPRLPPAIVDRLVDHFESLQRLLAANLEDLMSVGGVGESRARAVREGLSAGGVEHPRAVRLTGWCTRSLPRCPSSTTG